jgi:hypothetical protein
MAAFSSLRPTSPSSWLDHPLVHLPVNPFEEQHHQPQPQQQQQQQHQQRYLRQTKTGVMYNPSQSSSPSLFFTECWLILVLPLFLISCCVVPFLCWGLHRQQTPDDADDEHYHHHQMETPHVLRQKILKSTALNKSCLVSTHTHTHARGALARGTVCWLFCSMECCFLSCSFQKFLPPPYQIDS